MDEETRLELLKREVMASGSSIYNDNLQLDLYNAEAAIKEMGITLDLTQYRDNSYLIGYAAWIFRQREDPKMEMPRWLEWGLNNLLFSQKAKAGMNRDRV